MLERILQGTGNAMASMISQLSGAITNIILDPIFIFVFKLGVNGAAIATIIGQMVSAVVSLLCVSKDKFIHLKPHHLKLQKKIVGQIYAVGAPTIVTNSIGTVMTSAMNSILISFTPTAVSVFGVYFKLQSFVFMPIFGLSNGAIPIIAFNYGARKKKRMTETIKLSAIIGAVIMLTGTLIFNLFPKALLSIFSATEEMYSIGIPALRTISLCFVSAAVAIALGGSFQATGFGFGTMIVSVSRQLLVLIPVAYTLSRMIGIVGVWWAFPIAEVMGLTISIIIYLHVYKTRIKVIEDKDEINC